MRRDHYRQNGQEKWGWWGDNGSVSPDFDGVRLLVRDLDVTFNSRMRRWTGAWLLDGWNARGPGMDTRQTFHRVR
jgi:hypothetical protein